MLVCVTAVPMNYIADNVSYGLCRTLSYILMATSYALLALSTPGSPYLQYAWVIHHPAALSLFSNGFHLCSLFPKYSRILVNTTCGLVAISRDQEITFLLRYHSIISDPNYQLHDSTSVVGRCSSRHAYQVRNFLHLVWNHDTRAHSDHFSLSMALHYWPRPVPQRRWRL